MGNIKNYTFDRLDFKLSNSDYWDFYLNSDAIKSTPHYSGNTIASFDFSDYDSLPLHPDFSVVDWNDGDFAFGVRSSVEWSGATSTYFSATTYGLTAYDNMTVDYVESDDNDAHTTLLSYLTGTTLVLTSGDTKLLINQVSGATGGHIYPVTLVIDSGTTGNYVNLCGGFYQGYYKLDGWDYQVLPTRYEKGFTVETWLRPSTGCTSGLTGTILNDTYTGNTGFFFYTGTRAENKFWNIFTGNTSSACTSGDTHMCMEVKETEVNINNVIVDGVMTDIALPLSPPPIDIKLIENNFLIFGRSRGSTCDNTNSIGGYGRIRANKDYSKDDKHYSQIIRQEQVNFQNQFLTFGRSQGSTCDAGSSDDGYGRTRANKDFTGFTQDVTELDKNADIIDNAIGFRIKDDGSIGYRLLTVSADCQTVEMEEEYSASGMVTSDQWEHIVVKWVNNDEFDECDLMYDDPRKGHLKFYVNSNLIFVSSELTEFVPKRLLEIQEKQIGVPYNISIGGGTQGLLESLTFDGQDPDDLGLIVEQNFAGSFIGDMSIFNLYNKNLSWCEIKDSYNDKLTIYR